MTARDFIDLYQRFCDERNWVLTRAQWMQLDVIARGMTAIEYRKFMNSPEGITFNTILKHLDDCSVIEELGVA